MVTKRNEERTFNFMNILRGYMGRESYLDAALLISEVKLEYDRKSTDDLVGERLYETMLTIADRLDIANPFKEREQVVRVYQAYADLGGEPDWELILARDERWFDYLTMSDALFLEYVNRFKFDAPTILIAEGEKFVPNLKRLVDGHSDVSFTITTENLTVLHVINRLFAGYTNVDVVQASIYEYGFINERYDLVLSVPGFGTRNLVDDQSFMCRELDAVALENLLLHTKGGGELIITMPARITFAEGRSGDLRRFIQQTYRVKEISELPEGVFARTGIRTYLFSIVNAKPENDDDIIIRRYSGKGQKSRRDAVDRLAIEEETFILMDELEELGDWNINKIFSQQDEEWLRFQKSSVRKVAMGDVAEIFRGKSVSAKDPNGSIGVVNISNIGDYDIDYSNLDHFDEEERKFVNYLLEDGDVLIPARGTAIRTAIFHAQTYPCIASSNVIVIRPDNKMLNSTYLKLFLDSPLGEKMISGIQQGTTIINIRYRDLNGLEIPLPSIEEQQKKADEYNKELAVYQEAIATAEKRWSEVLEKLRAF